MGDTYRVMVIRETEDEDGEMNSTRVIELAAPVEMLRQFAPQAVAAALGAGAPVTDEQLDDARKRLQGIGVISSNDEPNGNYGHGQPKSRKPRRTKAEMEAARAAETVESAESETTESDTEPIPGEKARAAHVAEVAEKNAYNPFGN